MEKCDELTEKNEVVNAQVSRMANEHEELSIKFDNLQCSLEILSNDNESLFRKEIDFLREQEIPTDKTKTLQAILGLYQ
jgi:hypothetical protein